MVPGRARQKNRAQFGGFWAASCSGAYRRRRRHYDSGARQHGHEFKHKLQSREPESGGNRNAQCEHGQRFQH